MIKRDDENNIVEVYFVDDIDYKLILGISIVSAVLLCYYNFLDIVNDNFDLKRIIIPVLLIVIGFLVSYILKIKSSIANITLEKEKITIYNVEPIYIKDITNINCNGNYLSIYFLENNFKKNIEIPISDYTKSKVYTLLIKDYVLNQNYNHIVFNI